jgi:hypothetical protein
MSEIPLTAEAFASVFTGYNRAVWPAPLLLSAAAAAVALLVWRRPEGAARVTLGFLAGLWIWCGIAYQLIHFAPVNPAAYGFAVLFVAGGALFAHAAVAARPQFTIRMDAAGIVGVSAVVYALALYPLLGWTLGHRYPAAPTFGAPCPTTIYTFGLLTLTSGPVPKRLLAAPTLWAVIGSSAVVQWGMLEDLAMPGIAVLTTVLLLRRSRAAQESSARFALA